VCQAVLPVQFPILFLFRQYRIRLTGKWDMSVKTKARSKKSPNPRSAKKSQISLVAPSPAPPTLPEPTQAVAGFSRLNICICLLLSLVTLAVYLRAVNGPFVDLDDQMYVIENRQVQQGLTSATLHWALTTTYAKNWHPLTWLSHALDCQLFGLNPAGHHLTSILLHVFNVAILFLLLVRVTGATGRSLVVAALFALHPINVESVVWVAERKNVLSMFFLLLTVAAYGWYARKPRVERYLLVFLLFAVALAAKPMVVTLPFLLLLIDFWPLQRVLGRGTPSEAFPLEQFPFWQLAVEKLPLLILSVASSVITVVAQRSVITGNQGLPLVLRLFNAIYAYAAYIGKALYPVGLSAFYPYEGLRIEAWKLLPCLLLLVGVTAWVWRQRSRLYLPVGWFWFLGSLVPMIGLVQVGDQAMADRYAYLSFLGLFALFVWGIADLAQSRKWNPRALPVAAGLVLAVFSGLAWWQIGFWRSNYDLWSHALSVTTDNYLAEDYMGTALLMDNFDKTGQHTSKEALIHFQNAVRIQPRDPISHLNLGADLHEHGRIKEAIEQYMTVLQLSHDPYLVNKSMIDLGAAYHQLGDFDQAKQYYLQVLKTDPRNEVAFENLGKLGMDERIQELKRSTVAAPSAAAYINLGQLQEASAHIADARASYQQALKLNPKSAEARQAIDALDHQLAN
jgi:protein O-mannosyl-transferase